jgi:hypothetical protein
MAAFMGTLEIFAACKSRKVPPNSPIAVLQAETITTSLISSPPAFLQYTFEFLGGSICAGFGNPTISGSDIFRAHSIVEAALKSKMRPPA